MDLSMLNDAQRMAVVSTEGPLLILAGAGSGKTRVITHRIAYLMEEKRVSPQEILAITFTNKAAKEMRERVISLNPMGGKVWISTFHAACVRMLRRDIDKLGYQRDFSIYDDDDQMKLIGLCMKELQVSDRTFPPREIKSRISDAKDRLMTPDEYEQENQQDFRMKTICQVYRLYEEKLKACQSLDFDDLLVKTLELFVQRPDVLNYYRGRFRYIHVDEYQDTSYAQYVFVKLLSDYHKNLCVVGDDDQSIYGWRGADIRNILEFERDFPDAMVIKLEQNYRSMGNILQAANQVIANNFGRKRKKLWTEKPGGDKLEVTELADEQQEANFIVRQMQLLHEQGRSFSQMAVLYRANAQSRVPEEALMRAGIPYSIYGGLRFYDRKEVKDVVAYLRVLINPHDDISFRRIINEPKRGIGEAALSAIQAQAIAHGVSLMEACPYAVDQPGFRASVKLGQFVKVMAELREMKDALPPDQWVDQVVEHTGYALQYSNQANDEGQARLENIQEFVGAIREFMQQEDEDEDAPEKTIEAFLENVALVSDLDNLEEGDGVMRLMTLHSAKGLEFPIVFIVGMEDGIFPGRRSFLEPEKLEEERRLCYVGITRAMERLYLTYARRRMLFGAVSANPPSRFLKEIDSELIHFRRQRPQGEDALRSQLSGSLMPNRRRADGAGAYAGAVRPGVNRPSEEAARPVSAPTAQPQPVRRAPQPTGAGFAAGDAVTHPKFGRGRVVAVQGEGARKVYAVAFDGQGVKSLMASVAPLERAEEE
ncbi:MAG: ATP-dependent helicase [Christensenellales bacterium]